MKILAIGNSFSEDATRYLQAIASSAGEELFVRNLYIGGCSLRMHAQNIADNAQNYAYEENAEGNEMISISEALKREKWDRITVQQSSGVSGLISSYEPYLTQVLDTVRKYCPDAEIAFHRTWAYETDSTHAEFVNYDRDQAKMYREILNATEKAASAHSLPIIKGGDFIQYLRTKPEFDYENGGLSLCRDGYHMSLDYGRYAVGLIWFIFFTGKPASSATFAPDGTDPRLIALIKREADNFISNDND